MTNKDDAINLVGISKFLFRKDDCYNQRFCAKCGTRLGWYYGENECYLVACESCNTKTVVQATSPNMALDKVGVGK